MDPYSFLLKVPLYCAYMVRLRPTFRVTASVRFWTYGVVKCGSIAERLTVLSVTRIGCIGFTCVGTGTMLVSFVMSRYSRPGPPVIIALYELPGGFASGPFSVLNRPPPPGRKLIWYPSRTVA